jgi:hypothetical protein
MMTVRQINELTRDGGNGRNVYVTMVGNPGSLPNRVTRARTKAGRMQVKLLWSGEWVTVDSVNFTIWAE